jgi:hypothetical protein
LDDIGVPRLRMPPIPWTMGVALIPYTGHMDTFMKRSWLGVIAEPFLSSDIHSGMIDE